MIKIKRVYEKPEKEDGTRILVDRIWPRGLSKKSAKVKFWLKDIAPSSDLRKWFGHDPKKWSRFKKRYKKELEEKKGIIKELKQTEKRDKIITLVYGAKDEEHNQARFLKEIL